MKRLETVPVWFLATAVALGLGVFWWTATRSHDGERSAGSRPVVLATTTSVYDTGLLDRLLPQFTEETGFPVKPLAVGSGQALALGARGAVDLLLVHSPAAEKSFIEQGHGQDRAAFAHNDFVLVGPADDPAGVRSRSSSAIEALLAIRRAGLEAGARFVSRGDQSGTHKKEQSLWGATGLMPRTESRRETSWYIEAGVGQAATLHLADQRRAYALTDRSTYLYLQDKLALVVVYEGDAELLNFYSVVTINPERHSNINRRGAEALREFLLSSAVQAQLRAFGQARFGRPLFFPDAEPARPADAR